MGEHILRRGTDLYAIRNGALMGVSYRGKILHPIVRPYAEDSTEPLLAVYI